MLILPDRVLHFFTSELMFIIVPRDMMAHQIPDYTGEGDPIQYIQKHESSFLGKTSNDNDFALLFTATLLRTTTY